MDKFYKKEELIMHNLFKIISYKKKIFLLFLLIGMIITSILEVVGIGSVIPIVYSISDDSFFEKYEFFKFIKNNFDLNSKEDTLFFFLKFFCGVYIIKNIYLILFHYLEGRFIYSFVRDISSKLYKGYIMRPYKTIIQENSSDMISKLTNELNVVQNYLTSLLNIYTEVTIFIFIFIFVLIFYSSKILLLLIIFGLVIFLFFLMFYRKIKSLGKNRKNYEILRAAKIQESVGGIKDIKIRNKENEFSLNYFSLANQISTFFYKYYAIQKIPRLYLETSIIICLSLLTFFLYNKEVAINEIFTILAINFAIFLRLLPSVNKIVNAINTHNWSKQSAYEIINLSQKKINKKKIFKGQFKKELTFKKLSYGYGDKKNLIINNLDLTIKKGDKVALIGNSGIGKSTFVDVLCGLLSPVKGDIKIDGKSLLNKSSFNLISYAPQTPFLFDDTLYYNVTLDHKINDKKLKKFDEILHICELTDFHLSNKRKSKNYTLGDKGVKISGGQKQRVGLARSLYSINEILILDEPTSSLELNLEKKIILKILKNFANKTIIAITHKESVAKKFNKILIFKNKKLIGYNKK